MNKEHFQEWKSHPVTKLFLKETEEAIQETRENSCIRDTVDQTALQVSRNEGFIEGVDALNAFIDNQMFSMEADNED